MTEYGGTNSLLANAEHRKTGLQDVDVGRGWGGFEVVRPVSVSAKGDEHREALIKI